MTSVGPEDDSHSFSIQVTSLTREEAAAPASRPRWVRPALTALALVALVVLFVTQGFPYLASLASVRAPRPKPPTVLRFAGQPFSCPMATAWSPDSTRFAVLGYTSCANPADLTAPDPTDGVLAIYDAAATDATHPARAVVHLDALVEKFGLPASITGNAQTLQHLQIEYTSLDWSPDGRAIALAYQGGTLLSGDGGSTVQPVPGTSGLLLVPATEAGAPARAFNREPASPLTYPATPLAPHSAVEWNIATGIPSIITVSASLAYTWQPNGTLTATAPLNTSQSPTVTPSGNHSGASSFALWQEGYLAIENPACGSSSGTVSPYVSLELATAGSVWSPDGTNLLVGGFGAFGKVATPVPAAALAGANGNSGCDDSTPLNALPLLPVRDAGLRAAIATLRAGDNLTLYWRSDGKRLITVSTPVAADAVADQTITVYDCVSGKVLARNDLRTSGYGEMVTWSPDGKRLLVADTRWSQITVFGASALGG